MIVEFLGPNFENKISDPTLNGFLKHQKNRFDSLSQYIKVQAKQRGYNTITYDEQWENKKEYCVIGRIVDNKEHKDHYELVFEDKNSATKKYIIYKVSTLED